MRAFLIALLLCLHIVCGKSLGGIKALFCSLQLDGQVYCWGRNSYGGLGSGSSGGSSSFPTRMLNVKQATDVSCGEYHSCIVDGGKARCAGQGSMLGRNVSYNMYTSSPVLVDVEGVKNEPVDQVYAGVNHNCLLTKQGGAKCWGNNHYGELGRGAPFTSAASEVWGYESNGVKDIAVGWFHTCMLTDQAKIVCAGRNHYGQLGRGVSSYGSFYNMSQVALSDDIVFIALSSGNYHTCAVRRANGAVLCWGFGSFGQLGMGSLASAVYVPTFVPGFSGPAQSVHCGPYNTFVLLQHSQGVSAFGQNNYGVLGLEDKVSRTSPLATFAHYATEIVEVRGGEDTTCILLQSGAVKCVGNDHYGQLGNGESGRVNSLALVDVYYLPIKVASTLEPTTAFTQEPTTTFTQEPTWSPTQPSDDNGPSLWWVWLVVLIPALCIIAAGCIVWKKRHPNGSIRQVIPGYSNLLDTTTPKQPGGEMFILSGGDQF